MLDCGFGLLKFTQLSQAGMLLAFFLLEMIKNHSPSLLSPISVQWMSESTSRFGGFAKRMDGRWDGESTIVHFSLLLSYLHIQLFSA